MSSTVLKALIDDEGCRPAFSARKSKIQNAKAENEMLVSPNSGRKNLCGSYNGWLAFADLGQE